MKDITKMSKREMRREIILARPVIWAAMYVNTCLIGGGTDRMLKEAQKALKETLANHVQLAVEDMSL